MKPAETMGKRTQKEIRPGLWLDSALALFFAEEETLVVSDIHWGYANVHRQQGNLFPVWGDPQIAGALDDLLKNYRPKKMIWLGDSIHGAKGRHAAENYLAGIAESVEMILIAGNHDRHWKREFHRSFRLRNFFFHHGDIPIEVPPGVVEVTGHWHPAFTHRDGAGLSLKIPVLVEQPFRLVMPAFSPWSKGTHWECGEEDQLWMIAPRRIWKRKAGMGL